MQLPAHDGTPLCSRPAAAELRPDAVLRPLWFTRLAIKPAFVHQDGDCQITVGTRGGTPTLFAECTEPARHVRKRRHGPKSCPDLAYSQPAAIDQPAGFGRRRRRCCGICAAARTGGRTQQGRVTCNRLGLRAVSLLLSRLSGTPQRKPRVQLAQRHRLFCCSTDCSPMVTRGMTTAPWPPNDGQQRDRDLPRAAIRRASTGEAPSTTWLRPRHNATVISSPAGADPRLDRRWHQR